MSLLGKFIFLFLFLFLADQVRAHYTFQLALNSWTNPMKWDYKNMCCDGNAPPFNCTNICDTRFEICIQPFSYRASEINCPYGRYDTQDDETFPDSDDITFSFGVNIAGNVPNPMTFTIPSSTSEGLRVRIAAYDFDDYQDDLIDIMRVGMQPINTSNSFVMLPEVTGQYNVGTLVISYRVQCIEGYCGPDCTQRNCNEPTSSTGTVNDIGPTSQVDTTYGPLSQVQFHSILAVLGLLLIFIVISTILCIFVAILVVCKRNKKRNNNTVIQGEVQVINSNRSDTTGTELSSVAGGHTEPTSAIFNSYNINTSMSPYPIIPSFSSQKQHSSNTTHSTTPSFGSLNNDGEEEEGEYDYMNTNALTQMTTHNSSNKLHLSDDESVIYTKPFETPVDPVYTKPHTKSGIHSNSVRFPTSENPAYGTT